MKSWKQRDWFVWVGLVVIALVALVGIWRVVVSYNIPNKDVGIETFKALLQLVIIGITGGLIASIIKDMEEERRRYEAIREFKKLILDQIVDAYSQTKQIRRLIRAQGSFPSNVTEDQKFILQAVYTEKMEELSNIQLKFENIGIKIVNSQDLFENPTELTAKIRTLDTYIGDDLIDEYEESLGIFDAQSQRCSLANLPKLRDFITLDYKKSKFKTHFVDPYKEVLKTLQQEILKTK